MARDSVEDFLGAGTTISEAGGAGVRRCSREGRRVTVKVRRSPDQVKRTRRPSHLTVALRSATATGESEAREASQDLEDMSPSVGSEPAQDVHFSGRQVLMPVTHSYVLPVFHPCPGGSLEGVWERPRYPRDRKNVIRR